MMSVTMMMLISGGRCYTNSDGNVNVQGRCDLCEIGQAALDAAGRDGLGSAGEG